MLDTDIIHKLTVLSNEDSNPINVNNLMKLVESNMKKMFDVRNMKLNMIKETNVRLIRKINGYNMKYN